MARTLKPRSKRQIDTSIAKAVEKDKESLKDMRRMFGGLANYCREHDVEPETVLIELAYFREVVMNALAHKHLATMSQQFKYPFSPDQAAVLDADYSLLQEEIEKTGMELVERISLEAKERAAASEGAEKAPQTRPTKPSERPIYIN
jgi:hypothetical protein